MNVLIAEDNPVNQEISAGLLELLDCTVTVVETGEQAVDAAARQAFDLVLMDCQMPVMDGFEATRVIRSSATDGRRLPIVALTAHQGEEVRAACEDAGMDGLLTKPFSREDLASLLQRWQPSAPPTPAPPAPLESRTSSLDPAPIAALRSLDPDGKRDLIQRAVIKFLDYSDNLVARLAHAVTLGDGDEVSRLAHSLKSSSANLGAADLAARCAELEKLSGAASLPEDIGHRLKSLQMAHRAAKRDLLALIQPG